MTSKDSLLDRLLFKFAKPDQVAFAQMDRVRFFQDKGIGHVLDLGCGNGIFLDLLRKANIKATGVDFNKDVVAKCRKNGFTDVFEDDVLSFLKKQEKESIFYDGIFCSHLIEHLPGAMGVELVSLCSKVLAPGGRLVFVTPNICNQYVWTKVFWLDPTHIRPYPRAFLEAMLEECGLEVVMSFDDKRTSFIYKPNRESIRRLIKDLLQYGTGVLDGMDSVVVAQQPI